MEDRRVNVNHSAWNGTESTTPLIMAIDRNNARSVELLLGRDDIDVNMEAVVNDEDEKLRITPVEAAVWADVEILDMLLSRDEIQVDDRALETAKKNQKRRHLQQLEARREKQE